LAVEVVGNRGAKLHVPRAAKHQFTLIRMITRRRTERRHEYKPHLARVLRVWAALEDASVHHDHVANLEPLSGEHLVEPQAAGLSSSGGAQFHVSRANDEKLTPTPGNTNQETDGSGLVRLAAHDLAVEDDDASRIEPLHPDYVLERKAVIPRA
jgi:hypothetical protein